MGIIVGFVVGWLGAGFILGLLRVPPTAAHGLSFVAGLICAACSA